MTRTSLSLLFLVATALTPSLGLAQDSDMTFTDSDMSAGSTSGDMTFDEVDTKKEAKAVAKSRKAELDLIRVIQRRPFLKRRRVELSPMAGTNVNDSLVNFVMVGGSLTYHLTEVMAIGLSGSVSLGDETDLYTDVIGDYDVFPEVSKILWDATLEFQYEILYGKFALFNTWIIPWSMYAVLGAGITATELDNNTTIVAGIEQRYFMNKWFTFNIALRDGIYQEEYPGGSELVNNLVLMAGVSFFIPPSFKYKTLK